MAKLRNFLAVWALSPDVHLDKLRVTNSNSQTQALAVGQKIQKK
jgi:hypothetical protein